MKRRILVVDDEKHMCEMLKKALELDGNALVSTASDGEEALSYLEKNDVDLVVTDISMPKLQGTDLFFKVKKFNPFIQIILITAYPSLENIAKMLEGGASDFIVKPFEIDKLLGIIDETFGRIDRWRELRKEWLKYSKTRTQ